MVPNAASAISGRNDSPSQDFFSFGYNDTSRYVQQIVTGTFDHSTDSETDDDPSNPEMPPLE